MLKAFNFVPTSIQLKVQEQEHERHKKRIENILHNNKKAKLREQEQQTNEKMSQMLQNNMKAVHNSKFQNIDKDNQYLLGKLVEISRKKPAFASNVDKSESNIGSKSLHGSYRKKETLRISMENEAFAKRLLSQQSTFDRKKAETDYKKHQALLNQIKRVSTSPNKINKQKLAPLTLEIKAPKKDLTIKSAGNKQIDKNFKIEKVASKDNKSSPTYVIKKEIKQEKQPEKVEKIEKVVKEEKVEKSEEKPEEKIQENEVHTEKQKSEAKLEENAQEKLSGSVQKLDKTPAASERKLENVEEDESAKKTENREEKVESKKDKDLNQGEVEEEIKEDVQDN